MDTYGLHHPIGQSGIKAIGKPECPDLPLFGIRWIGSASRAWLETQSGKRPQWVIRIAKSVRDSIHWPGVAPMQRTFEKSQSLQTNCWRRTAWKQKGVCFPPLLYFRKARGVCFPLLHYCREKERAGFAYRNSSISVSLSLCLSVALSLCLSVSL